MSRSAKPAQLYAMQGVRLVRLVLLVRLERLSEADA